jgi:hypothetical protein
MQLLVAHQVLIGAAIALATLFGLRGLVLFKNGQGAANLVMALVSLAVAGALVAYFRKVRARWLAARAERRPR